VQNGQTEKTIVEIAVRGVETGEHDGMAFRSLYENLDARNTALCSMVSPPPDFVPL
jgi:hypothetical protein